jgi:HSP20 family protein
MREEVMTNLVRFAPQSAVSVFGDLDRLIEDLRGGQRSLASGAGAWIPSSDVIERGDHYILRLDLPGVKKDDIQVSVEDGALMIRGQRLHESAEESDNVLRTERMTGTFSRRFRLGDRIDTGKIEANYRDGVLEVRVPKAEEAKTRLIEVR